MELHLWRNQVVDWYVAESAAEAAVLARAYQEVLGTDPEEMDLEFSQEPDDRALTFVHEDGRRETKSCREWARDTPKGFWGSTEC